MARFDSLQGWLRWQEGLHPRVIDMGLDRAAGVYQQLNPDNVKPPTITVAGTNGKGSCIAFLEAIYRAQGYKVGAYTSPHILKYNERIKIDGQPVADDLICSAFERIDAARGEATLSYFEFGTLAALDLFWRSKVDVQLLEVGLGGRLDAVNIIDADAAIVTSICIDHVDWLGETREAIGQEKAGIFRSGVPAVIGDTDPPQSLLAVARQKHTPLLRIGDDFGYRKTDGGWEWRYADRLLTQLPLPALQGEHQFRNAASVLTAISTLAERLPVSEQAMRQGLTEVKLSGRFQLIDSDIPVLLDVGHNPQAVRTLLEYLQQHYAGVKIHAVFAMMQDKDISGVIKIISPVISAWYLAPLSNPRAASEAMVKQCFNDNQVDHVTGGFANFSEAFSAAQQQAKQDELILVFGSFFLVSEYLASC
ncbi:bifunctional tetrahydrofolate synthase/dihydrofolate synthase [Methylomarinum sp. Ch1-1]|uniref:Dihydrofolate synthase/folylpolyglutamate synthase n=1 Tax=Methylomarinum roseum TaxID=3067653 RepID=A0AAU7NPZ2_9GAMM|nr:bifunctional tetrahydrofolate synthase/dihydrofolate synthase [Methylomarinum sp. Ch1-1]MDP4521045.1 bifunctional tetrahydrofolate synthase/dihydrofolate synthase [Methylomarinum sp. Ch1-1]